MQWYHYGMGGLFALAFILSYKTPRAWIWLLTLFASYAGSIVYLRYYQSLETANAIATEWPTIAIFEGIEWIPLDRAWLPPSAIAAMLDLSIAFFVHRFGRERWETVHLFHGALFMALANLLFFTSTLLGFPPRPSQEILGIGLEIVNVALFVLIMHTGITDLIGGGHGHRNTGRALDWILETGRALHKPYKRKLWEE